MNILIVFFSLQGWGASGELSRIPQGTLASSVKIVGANGESCGGVIIDSSWVASAAHCAETAVENQGTMTLNFSGRKIEVSTESIFIHPRYLKEQVKPDSVITLNDIVLIRVAKVPSGEAVKRAQSNKFDSAFLLRPSGPVDLEPIESEIAALRGQAGFKTKVSSEKGRLGDSGNAVFTRSASPEAIGVVAMIHTLDEDVFIIIETFNKHNGWIQSVMSSSLARSNH